MLTLSLRCGIILLAAHSLLLGQTVTIDAGSPSDGGFSSPPADSCDFTSCATTAYTIPSTPAAVTDPTMRYGPQFTYHIPVSAPGFYQLTLNFVEPTVQGAGQRVFSVTANDQPILTGLDLFATAGYLVPTSRSVLLAVTGAAIDIVFTAQVRNAVISSISVTEVWLAPLLQACTQPPSCAGLLYGQIPVSGTLSGYWLVPVSAGFAPDASWVPVSPGS